MIRNDSKLVAASSRTETANRTKLSGSTRKGQARTTGGEQQYGHSRPSRR